jgi:methylmalonyl-CoA mutase cobalamin-binding subunit
MDEQRAAEAVWLNEHDAVQQADAGARKAPDYQRLTPEAPRSKTTAWISEGHTGRMGFSGQPQRGVNSDSPSIHARSDDDAAPGRRFDDSVGQNPAFGREHHRQKIIRPWSNLLERALELEVFPRLLEARRAGAAEASHAVLGSAEIEEFVGLILAETMAPASEMVRTLLRRIERTALLDELFAPAARRLGVLWEQDRCGFADVTLGILRLDRMMHEIEAEEAAPHFPRRHDRRALLMPVPGDQHSFGIGMVADAFRRGGWHVWSGKTVTRPELLRLVRRETFHVVGFSSTNERLVGQLPSCIRAVRRASRNPGIRVMVGGRYFLGHPDQVAVTGADALARDARDALRQANGLLAALAAADR